MWYNGAQHSEYYGQSKLVLLLFTYELARRLEGTGIVANAVHPGFADTNIGQGYGRLYGLGQPSVRLIAQSPEEAARMSIYLASSAGVEGVTGQYFKDRMSVSFALTAYDETAARCLWVICAATPRL